MVSTDVEGQNISMPNLHCHSKAIKSALDKEARRKLIIASVLCLLFMIGEIIGGFMADSLAIISDAAHLLTDLASFMISLVAIHLASRPATSKFSFGWHRAEILGAFSSILLLWVLTGILAFEAVERFRTEDFEIDATIMLITAAIGVGFNILLGTNLHQHSHSHGGGASNDHAHDNNSNRNSHSDPAPITKNSQGYGTLSAPAESGVNNSHEVTVPTENDHQGDKGEGLGHGHSHGSKSNINVKAAFIHVLGDLLQSIGVLAAAIIIYFKPEWKLADPICTFLFSFFVLVTTLTVMRDIVMVLMEAAPRGLRFHDVRDALLSVSNVVDIHDLRLWSLTIDKIAISAHLAIQRDCDAQDVLTAARSVVRKNFSITEMTFQIEEYVEEMDDCNDCKVPKH